MIYVPYLAAFGISLTVRLIIELAIANHLLPKDPDQDRASKYVILANAIAHPIFFGLIALALRYELWSLLIATPVVELAGAVFKVVLFGRVGEKRDSLVALFTACFGSGLSLIVALVAVWTVLQLGVFWSLGG